MMRRYLLPVRCWRWLLAYPLLVTDAVLAATRRAGAARRDRAPRPGTSSAAMPGRSRSGTPCSSASAPTAALVVYHHSACRRLPAPSALLVASLIAALIGVPTLRLSGHYFSMATIAVAELCACCRHQLRVPRRGGQGCGGPAVPRTVFDLSFTRRLPYYYHLPGVLVVAARLTWGSSAAAWASICAPSRTASAPRARWASPAGRYKLYAYMLSAPSPRRGLALRHACSASSIPSPASAS